MWYCPDALMMISWVDLFDAVIDAMMLPCVLTSDD